MMVWPGTGQNNRACTFVGFLKLYQPASLSEKYETMDVNGPPALCHHCLAK